MNRKAKIFSVFMMLSVSIFLLDSWSEETKFMLRSSEVTDGGTLPVEFTGDGASASPPLVWTGVPKGTQSLVLIMHHLDPEGKTKIYWLMYDIDPKTTSVAKNATDFGKIEWSVNGQAAESLALRPPDADQEPSADARFAALVCTFAQWLANDPATTIDLRFEGQVILKPPEIEE